MSLRPLRLWVVAGAAGAMLAACGPVDGNGTAANEAAAGSASGAYPAAAVLTAFRTACSDLGSLDGAATRLRGALPGARHVALGELQHPPLDGPVDLRHGTRGELIR